MQPRTITLKSEQPPVRKPVAIGPKVLLTCTGRWLTSARLALAFVDAGCRAEAVCPTDHPIARTRLVPAPYRYRALAPLQSFRAAIEKARPDLIVPCDEIASSLLHQLHRIAAQTDCEALRLLLERSLGDPAGFEVVASRSRFVAFAAELGIRTPPTAVVETPHGLKRWLDGNGFPALLKADGTSGGAGVRVVHSAAEAAEMWTALHAPPSLARAAKRAVVNRDWHYVSRWIRRSRPVVSAQRFIAGQDANAAVACWQGQVLAMTTAVVLQTWYPRGPATVVRVVDHPQILRAVTCIVRHLRLSGLYGFDFLIDNENGDSYLIEVNPRATQTCHLRLGPGRDLPGSLTAALTGRPLPAADAMTENDVIALFPQEWLRDPASPFLNRAFHDVPWDEPKLVRAAIEEDFRFKAWTVLSSGTKRLFQRG